MRYWIHGEHLLVNGEKMSKSLGNTFTLRTLEEKGFSPLDFRYLTLTAHYRSKLNFTWQSLQSARNARNELEEFVRELLKERQAHKKRKSSKQPYGAAEKRFFEAVSNDLNTPLALGILWKWIRVYRKSKTRQSSGQAKNPSAAHTLLIRADEILGLGLRDIKLLKIPVAIQQLVAKREQARKNKFWLEADRIRLEIEKKGWNVKDTPQGPSIHRL